MPLPSGAHSSTRTGRLKLGNSSFGDTVSHDIVIPTPGKHTLSTTALATCPFNCNDACMDRPGDATPSREIYSIVDEQIDAPKLPGRVIVLETADDVIDRVGEDLVAHAQQCVRDFEDFHLALSGGSTPEPLYRRLMYDPDFRRLPWRRTHLWIVDERCVDANDELSNYKMIRETIVDHADIPPEQVHPMHATDSDADVDYERAFKSEMLYRPTGEDRLDYVLLGMGADGHTASLFPNSEALREERRLVRRVHHVSASPPDRITMTYPLLNAARVVSVLVIGSGKAATLQRVADAADDATVLPIRGIHPRAGELIWYLDAAAAGAADRDRDPPCANM